MSKIITKDLKSLIDEVMKHEGEENYELNISENGMKGDGYMGELTYIIVKSGINDYKKQYDFVIKSAQKNDKLRKKIPIRETYLREILIYNEIFPAFEQFQLENLIQNPFNKYPKCYKVCKDTNSEMIILQNLKIQGFEMHNKTVSMNLDHVQSILVQYARFHAISLAMKQLKPKMFRNLTKNMDNVFAHFLSQSNMIPGFVESFEKGLKLINSNERKKFQGYESEIEKLLTKTIFDIDDPITVIIHGDCWNNNFMFKYNQTNKTKPIDVRFLDFQYSRVAHPIFDLSNFLYTCGDREILKKINSLLDLYHSALLDSLSQYGIDVNKFLPLNKLRKDWKEFGKFGLFDAILVIQLAFSDSTETLDLEKMVENDKEFKDEVLLMKKDDELYNKRVKAILEHFSQTFL